MADDVPELVHHLHHLLVLLPLLAGHAAGLQALEQVAELAQHLLGILARALTGHVLDVAHHALEITLAQHLLRRLAGRHLLRRLALGLTCELLHELVERLTELVHEALDLFVGGTLLKGLGEIFLGLAQAAFYTVQYQGRDYHVLVQGDYPNREAARVAIADLPAALRRGGPWPRPFADVQREVRSGVK